MRLAKPAEARPSPRRAVPASVVPTTMLAAACFLAACLLVACLVVAMPRALAQVPAPPGAATGGPVPVDVELVLAVDVSWSMDADEQALQRAGYVAAFRDPEVQAVIAGGLHGRIAVTFYEWAGTGLIDVIAPWTPVGSAEDAERFAAQLAGDAPGRMSRTSISGAIDAGVRAFEGNGFRGLRRVIDVSGDGPNNQGRPVTHARDAAAATGVTVNGLALILKPYDPRFGVRELDLYYEDCVIGGPGAFVITVREPDGFADAIKRKLILEIAGAPARLRRAQATGRPAPRIDCLIGEKLWRDRIREPF